MVLLNATLTDLFLDNVVVYHYLIHHNFYVMDYQLFFSTMDVEE